MTSDPTKRSCKGLPLSATIQQKAPMPRSVESRWTTIWLCTGGLCDWRGDVWLATTILYTVFSFKPFFGEFLLKGGDWLGFVVMLVAYVTVNVLSLNCWVGWLFLFFVCWIWFLSSLLLLLQVLLFFGGYFGGYGGGWSQVLLVWSVRFTRKTRRQCREQVKKNFHL